jgi:hypothetical protein
MLNCPTSSVRTFLCVKKLRTVPACIHPNVLATYPDVVQQLDFFPKHIYEKTAATVQTMCVPVRTLSFIRQVVHSKFNRPDISLQGPDAPTLDMEIACS